MGLRKYKDMRRLEQLSFRAMGTTCSATLTMAADSPRSILRFSFVRISVMISGDNVAVAEAPVHHREPEPEAAEATRLLRDLGIADLQTMLDGIAAPIERALHTFTAIRVAGNFLSPAVGFVHDRFQFFHGEGRL